MQQSPSYNYSIAFAKAYRVLRTEVYACLEKYQLIPTHWSLIGLVYEVKTGISISDAAGALGVKIPLVTVMVDYLESKKLIKRVAHKTDGRSKMLVPTKSGEAKVKTIDEDINTTLTPLLAGVSAEDLNTFKTVLQTIISNERVL